MEQATVREDLAFLRSLMDESQAFLCGTWRHQLVWGLVGISGLAGTWVSMNVGAFGRIPWIWGVWVGVGWFYSLLLARRDAFRPSARSVASRAFGGIWLALGVTLTLLGLATMFTGAVDPLGLPGIIAIVFGAGYFASGYVGGLQWLKGVGALWWGGGVALLIWSSPDALLGLAGMTLPLGIGPALRLRRTERDAADL